MSGSIVDTGAVCSYANDACSTSAVLDPAATSPSSLTCAVPAVAAGEQAAGSPNGRISALTLRLTEAVAKLGGEGSAASEVIKAALGSERFYLGFADGAGSAVVDVVESHVGDVLELLQKLAQDPLFNAGAALVTVASLEVGDERAMILAADTVRELAGASTDVTSQILLALASRILAAQSFKKRIRAWSESGFLEIATEASAVVVQLVAEEATTIAGLKDPRHVGYAVGHACARVVAEVYMSIWVI